MKVKERLGFSEFVGFDEGSGVSGDSNPFERDVCKNLIEQIKNHKVKHLYIYEWSRISRNNFYSEYLRKLILDKKVLLYIGDSDKPKDLSDPMDKLTESILSSIYTFERDNLIKRIRDGLIQSKMKMRWSGIYLPYGYKKNSDGIVTIDEIESGIYLQMKDFVLEGKSIRWITNWLNKSNVPTKYQRVNKKGFIKKNKDGKEIKIESSNLMWRDNTVRRIIENEYYKGVRKDKNGNVYPFPPILDEKEWDELQSIYQKNKIKNRSGNKSKHNYLLKGLLYCKRDSAKLLGRKKKDENTYYCSRKRKEVRYKDEKICSLPSPNIHRIENFIWEVLVNTLSNSTLIKEEFKVNELKPLKVKKNKNKLQNSIYTIRENIKSVDIKKEKLLNLFLDGNVDDQLYQKKKIELDEEIKKYSKDIEVEEFKLKILNNEKTFIDWVKKFTNEVKKWKVESSFEYKREKILKYIDRIDIDYDDEQKQYDIDIRFNIPIVNDKLIWENPNKKSEGYKLYDGSNYLRIKNNLKKNPINKTTYQFTSTSVMVK